MILGKLKNIGRYAGLYANLDKAIRFLEENNPMDFEAGSYPIDGDEVYMNRFDYWTDPEGEIFEGHRDYLDIHIAADGCEYLCCAPAEELQVKEAYSRAGDCCLYTGKPKVRFLMGEGDFAICFPEDAHMPKISTGKPEYVRKAVIKVRLRQEAE